MMKILEIIKRLEKSKEFAAYKKNNSAFLAHAFIMLDENDNGEWQFGYFNKKDQKMTSFFYGNQIEASQETEIFKKPDSTIHELDLKRIKIDFGKAKETAESMLQKKYSGEKPVKKIFILQNLDKQMWNITFLTTKYKIINIRIDSETGSTIKDESISIMQFKAG